jgi:hypothetical protein
MTESEMLRDAEKLSMQIRPMLAGHHPSVQGAVLADLLAVWIVGHYPEARDEILQLHIDTVRELIPVTEKEIFGDDGFPIDQKQR